MNKWTPGTGQNSHISVSGAGGGVILPAPPECIKGDETEGKQDEQKIAFNNFGLLVNIDLHH